MRLRRAGPLLLCAALVAGCTTSTAGQGRPAQRRAHTLPSSGNLLSIRDFPIYKAPEYGFRAVASLLVTADGLAIRSVTDPTATAIPRFRSARLDHSQLLELVDLADRLGLLGEPLDFGTPAVSVPTGTSLSFTVDGQTVIQTEITVGIGVDTHLSDIERDRRDRLTTFRNFVQGLVGGDAVPFRAPRLAVLRKSDHTPRSSTVVAWPLRADELPKVNGCRVYSGMAARLIESVAESAYVEAGWAVAGFRTTMYFRPILPNTPGCP
jgi:hypothetical protein